MSSGKPALCIGSPSTCAASGRLPAENQSSGSTMWTCGAQLAAGGALCVAAGTSSDSSVCQVHSNLSFPL
jgi:hypothetical protein